MEKDKLKIPRKGYIYIYQVLRSNGNAVVIILLQHFFLLFFFIPFIILELLSRSLPVVTQIRDQGPLLPPPHYGTCLQFLSREEFCISSLGDSLRIVPIHAARRSQQSLLFFRILQIKSNLLMVSIELKDQRY